MTNLEMCISIRLNSMILEPYRIKILKEFSGCTSDSLYEIKDNDIVCLKCGNKFVKLFYNRQGSTILEKTNNLLCFYPQYLSFEYLNNQVESLNLKEFVRFSILKCLEKNQSKLILIENSPNMEIITIFFNIDKSILYSSECTIIDNETNINEFNPLMKVIHLIYLRLDMQ